MLRVDGLLPRRSGQLPVGVRLLALILLLMLLGCFSNLVHGSCLVCLVVVGCALLAGYLVFPSTAGAAKCYSRLLQDPAREAAAAKTEAAFNKINYYDNMRDAKRLLSQIILPSQKVLIVVDTPTSKSRTPLAIIDSITDVIKTLGVTKYRILVPEGTRMDLAVAVQNKMTVGMAQETILKF